MALEGERVRAHNLHRLPGRIHLNRFGAASPKSPAPNTTLLSPKQRATTMSTITTKDGTEISYKDWGTGPIVTFSHGWPLNSDAWDGQMLFLAQHGYRCIGVDRRGHGRSSQAAAHNDMDGYAERSEESRVGK